MTDGHSEWFSHSSNNLVNSGAEVSRCALAYLARPTNVQSREIARQSRTLIIDAVRLKESLSQPCRVKL